MSVVEAGPASHTGGVVTPEPLYDRLITEIFRRHDGASTHEFEFERDEMTDILRDWARG